ncbi:hypothetical protein B0H11DRAFT_1902333 [Mycena galericulata]|nr:hypothetical protein B0H11DRAFT_1902333 [Mycena galericulata]
MCEYSDECRCLRYIPQENPGPGPRLCRDCEHWESLHPAATAPKGPVSDVFSQLLPQIQKVRQGDAALVSDSEARSEASTGFRKAVEGRGGDTRFKKKSARNKSGTAPTKDDLPVHVGRVVLISNAIWPSEEDTNAPDVQHMGVATVPEVARFQKMKDGGLAVEADDYDEGIRFKEAWGAQRIDKFLRFYFPAALKHQDEKHVLHEGEYHWVPLSAERKKLIEFKKKDEINGKDLLKIKAGKGKEVRETTLYFALRFPVHDKVWSNGWGANQSDDEWTSKSKGRKIATKSKPRREGISTRSSAQSSSRKAEPAEADSSDSDASIIEVEAPKLERKPQAPGPSSRSAPGKASKIKADETTPATAADTAVARRRRSPIRVKLEPELAEIADKEFLELEQDSDSDSDSFKLKADSPLPGSLDLTVPAQPAGPATLFTPVSSSTVYATTSGAASSDLVGQSPFHVVPSIAAPFGSSSAGPVSTSAPTLNHTPAAGNILPDSAYLSSWSDRHSLVSQHSSTHPSGSSGSAHTSLSAFGGSSSADRSRYYASTTDALDAYNQFGNYREGTPPKRSITSVMSSGFPSPERPFKNPWKRPKTDDA